MTSDSASTFSSTPTSELLQYEKDCKDIEGVMEEEYPVVREKRVTLSVPEISSEFNLSSSQPTLQPSGNKRQRGDRNVKVEIEEMDPVERIRKKNREGQARRRRRKKQTNEELATLSEQLQYEIDSLTKRLNAALAENEVLKEQNDFLKTLVNKDSEPFSMGTSSSSKHSKSSSSTYVFFAFACFFFVFDYLFFSFSSSSSSSSSPNLSSDDQILLSSKDDGDFPLFNSSSYLQSPSFSLLPFLGALLSVIAVKYLLTKNQESKEQLPRSVK